MCEQKQVERDGQRMSGVIANWGMLDVLTKVTLQAVCFGEPVCSDLQAKWVLERTIR
jgi:hypothetical protein